MTIPEALQQLMKQEGLNNITFAQMLGVSHGTTSRYILGTRTPPLNRMKQIARVFNRRLELVIENDKIKGKFVFRDQVRQPSFNEKIAECRSALKHYAIGIMKLSYESTEDIVQETLLKGMLLSHTWRPEVAMTTWLIGIMKRSRTKKRHNVVYIEDYIETEHLTAEAEVMFTEKPKLFKYVESLSKNDRAYFKLYATGVPYKLIAIEMNTTEKYVKTKIKLIKTNLYTRMSREKSR